MGLLSQILGGLAGGALGGRSPMGGGLGGGMGGLGGLGGGKSRVVMALLPVVLGMLANRRGSGMGGAMGGGLPGGLGGMLGGGAASGGMGGLGGLLEQFTRKGYGNHAQSWVGAGANEPLAPEAVADVFGDDQLAQIASEAGVSTDEARDGLAELLPEAVDHFTPEGRMPVQDELLSSIDDYLARTKS